MSRFASGITIMSTLQGGVAHAMTANAFTSVSLDPPLVLVCVDKNSNTLPGLRHSGKFVVNYLASGRGDLANLFASKEPDKFQSVSWRPASNGMPWLHTDTIAHAECSITQEVEVGDHLVFIAEVQDGQPPAPGTKPLMYFRRSYGTWHE